MAKHFTLHFLSRFHMIWPFSKKQKPDPTKIPGFTIQKDKKSKISTIFSNIGISVWYINLYKTEKFSEDFYLLILRIFGINISNIVKEFAVQRIFSTTSRRLTSIRSTSCSLQVTSSTLVLKGHIQPPPLFKESYLLEKNLALVIRSDTPVNSLFWLYFITQKK